MHRLLLRALCAAALTLPAASAEAFLFVSGGPARSGDLVGVWSKNGFELIVNLGPVDQITLGPLASIDVPTEFEGSLIGARFTAFAVPEPDRLATNVPLDPKPAQFNIALTTLDDPARIGFVQLGEAQAVLDPAAGAQGWLKLLNTLPAADGGQIVRNSNDEALISSNLFQSYAGNLGFSTDTIANTVPTQSVVTVDPDGTGAQYAIPLFEVNATFQQDGADFVLGTTVTDIGALAGDNGESGLAQLSLVPVPEPQSVVAALAAMVTLAGVARRRQRAGA